MVLQHLLYGVYCPAKGDNTNESYIFQHHVVENSVTTMGTESCEGCTSSQNSECCIKNIPHLTKNLISCCVAEFQARVCAWDEPLFLPLLVRLGSLPGMIPCGFVPLRRFAPAGHCRCELCATSMNYSTAHFLHILRSACQPRFIRDTSPETRPKTSFRT